MVCNVQLADVDVIDSANICNYPSLSVTFKGRRNAKSAIVFLSLRKRDELRGLRCSLVALNLEEHSRYQIVNLSQGSHYQAAANDTSLNVNTVAPKRTNYRWRLNKNFKKKLHEALKRNRLRLNGLDSYDTG